MGRMIYVVGNSRSGTTMMGRVLGGHKSVFTFNELHFFEQLWAPTTNPETIGREAACDYIAKLLTIQRDGYYTQSDPQGYIDEASGIVDALDGPLTPPGIFEAFIQYECAQHDRTIGCDQTPRNLYYLDELLKLYPDARFVVMIRDPRDVLLSQKHRWKRRQLGAKSTPWWNALRTWAGYHPITISMLWRSGVATGDKYADNPRVCVIRFEDLLADAATELQKVCATTGLDYDPAMLDVPRVGSSHEQDRPGERGLDPAAAGRWRLGGLTQTELAICQHITGKNMRRHGYKAEPLCASLFVMAWCRVTWVFKSALALTLNIRRIKSLRESLRRRLGR
jgi:hypothetical protein